MDDDRKPTSPDLRETLPTLAGNVDPADQLTLPDFVEHEFDIPTLSEGTQVGKYTIEKVLGVGGMGAVYRATQSKPKRQVALKLIRQGVLSSKSIRRFDLEAEILGRLDHPNIAKIHEAGIDSTTGSPYFAMEYVAGQELGPYILEHKPTFRERLELFVKLCDAIQHAHAKGVIHRDLKPANVLIDADGEPKVLDFGVARATDSTSQAMTLQTNVGQLIGTLYYMSPEQATGDTLNLDIRSDVYALGVVLFEVLTGHLPYDLEEKAIHEAVRVIVYTNPTKLSLFDSTLKGDIEIIVGKALDKTKERRYQSVADLSADIRRMLANQPITARPPSIIDKSTKFVKRNTGLTIAAACMLVVLTTGTIFASAQVVRRIEARRLALDNMLTALNEMDVQKGLGPDLTKRLLDLYAENGETLFSGDPESLALLFTNLGEAYHGYEDYTSAMDSFQRAYKIRNRSYSSPHPLIADSLHRVASAEFYLSNFAVARTHYEETLAMRQALFEPTDPEASEIARTLDHLGSTCAKLGDHESAIAMYNQARDIRVTLFGPKSLEVAMSNNSIAWLYVQQSQYETAEPIYREALSLLEGLPEDDSKPLWIARAKHSLGNTLIHLKNYEEASLLLREALDLKQALLGSDKPTVVLTLQSLAESLYHQRDYDQAEIYAQRVVEIREELGDPKLENAERLLAAIQQRANE
jgi:eukaryotic-like serine/threonine-protein kinase